MANVSKLPNCPNCAHTSVTVLGEWDYAKFHVKNIKCLECQTKFNAYFWQDKLSHVIDNKNLGPRSVIIRYLREHSVAREEEIAKALQLSIAEVEIILEKLEKRGIVDKVTSVDYPTKTNGEKKTAPDC